MAAPKSDKEATRDGAKKKREGTVDADAVVAAVAAAKEGLKECPECGSKGLICEYGKAEILCEDCGLIITENIVDLGPEWRAFEFRTRSQNERGRAHR